MVDTTDGCKGDAQTPVSVAEEAIVAKQSSDQFHQRPPTRSGGRHMQESSFSFSGECDCCYIFLFILFAVIQEFDFFVYISEYLFNYDLR